MSAEANSAYIPAIASLAPFAQSRIENYFLRSYKKRIEQTRASLQLIHALIYHPQSVYKNPVLYPDSHPPLPYDLLQDHLFAEGFAHWEQVGAGFVGLSTYF